MYVLPEWRIGESIKIIKKMFELCENPYIALSFGKDSLVLLDLIYSIKKIECIFLKSEESYLMYNYEQIIEKYKRSHAIKLKIVDTKRLTESAMNWQIARKKGNKDFLLDEFFGYDGIFMGLRIEESRARKITLIRKENNIISPRIMMYKNGKRKGMLRCCPISNWKKAEVYSYLKVKNLPMLDIYESEGENIRTTARLTGDAVRNNSLFWIRKNKPENFNKITKILPELRYFI